MTNKAASELSKLKWKKLRKTMTKEQISEMQRGYVNKRWANQKKDVPNPAEKD